MLKNRLLAITMDDNQESDIVANFKLGAEKMIQYLNDILDLKLKSHLISMKQITNKVAKIDNDYAVILDTLREDISSVEDHCHTVYISTKGVVEYGTSELIPEIQKLIQGKRYHEAASKTKQFLHNLKERIKIVENDLKLINEDHTSEIQSRIKRIRIQNSDAKEQLKCEVSLAKRGELLQIGKSSLFYFLMGSAAAVTVLILLPNFDVKSSVGKAMKNLAEKAGTDVIGFSFKNFLQELGSVHATSSAFYELQKEVELNASNIDNCLREFFTTITEYKIQLTTTVNNTKSLNNYVDETQKKLSSHPTDESVDDDWINIGIFLKQIFASLKYLERKAIENSKTYYAK